jgi:voltage-gated potassium channel
MALAGEQAITAPENFFYWLIVTASTVGYGDLSPATPLGKIVVSLWVIPLGLSLFAFIVARAGFYLSELAYKGKRGLRMLQIKDHIVIIGWNGSRTLRLIELLLSKRDASSRAIVLCVTEDMENPLTNEINFVRAKTFAHHDTMKHANLVEATSIIIDTPQDDVTLTTALYCQKVSPNCHITAYFQDETIGDLLQTHCPSVETVPSVSVEMLAKSTMDPGSSLLHKQLLDGTHGMTQYSVLCSGKAVTTEVLFTHFKQNLSATIIGVKPKSERRIRINPSLEEMINVGDVLYYIANRRLSAQECFEFKE